MVSRVNELALWVCADLSAAPAEAIIDRVSAVLDRLPVCVWLRSDGTTPAVRLVEIARRLAVKSRSAGGALLVGDRLDVAIVSEASGVHLGTRSISPRDARHLLSHHGLAEGFVISVAVHDAASITEAAPHANVLVLSPLKDVPGKGRPLGVGGFAALVSLAPARPFVALGGIVHESDAIDAARAGARAIAVRRALLDSTDPAATCAALHDAFLSARQSTPTA